MLMEARVNLVCHLSWRELDFVHSFSFLVLCMDWASCIVYV